MNKIKYALCIFIAATVTCAVVFLPYLYYSSIDKRDINNYVTESYSFESKNDNITSEELISLLSSDEAIWLESNTYSMYYDGKQFNDLLDEIDSAQPLLKSAFNDNELANMAIEKFYEVASQISAYKVQEVTVNGEINGSPISVTLLDVVYSDFSENGAGEFEILMDKKTKIVYEFKCTPKEPIVQDDFIDEHDLNETVEQNLREQTCLDLCNYWNIDGEYKYNVETSFYSFYFNIMPLAFTDYEFNNYNSIMYGYDKTDSGYEISEKNNYY